MNIQIENYFGENMLIVNFTTVNPTPERIELATNIAERYGFNHADTDEDDYGNEYIRLQYETKNVTDNELMYNIKDLVDELFKELIIC